MIRSKLLFKLAMLIAVAAPLMGIALRSRVDAAAPTSGLTPPAVHVMTAAKRELIDALSVDGTVVARQEATVDADLNGLKIVAINVDAGDAVGKGDVLAVLDRSALDVQLAEIEANRAQAEAGVAQMQAQITEAEVSVRQADQTLERVRALQTKGVSTQAQLDDAINSLDREKAKLEVANKSLAATQAQVGVIDAQKQNVMLQISKTELRAPAAGLVLTRDATLGEVVSSSGGPLFRIAIGSKLELVATVMETALPRLEPGMPVEVYAASAPHPIRGSIRWISPEVNQTSRLGSLRIALAPGSDVRVGNFARGVVQVARQDGITVPSSAILYDGTNPFVQVVDDGRVRTTAVTLGIASSGFVQIVSGLAEGSEVVARAGTFLADGDTITPVPVDDAAQAAKP